MTSTPNSGAGTPRRLPTATHWGNYEVVTDGDGGIDKLEPAADDPRPSPIGRGVADAHHARNRILQPMVRRGWLEHGPRYDGGGRGAEPFVPVSWDEAGSLIATELDRVRERYGNEAIYGGSYGWGSAGRFHHAQSQVHRFLNVLGGFTSSVGSYSAAAMEAVMPHVIGGGPWNAVAQNPLWREIADQGELVVSFGGLAAKNAQANSGGVGRHQAVDWQRRCRDNGVAFVNVSPWRSDAHEALGADWVPLRPNTDVPLMLALAHVLITEGRHDADFMARCCTGFEVFERYVLGRSDGVVKDPAWAAELTGVDPGTIVGLARRIARHRTVINVSFSVQRQDHGEQPYWTAVVLAALSGSMGRTGGGFAAALGISQTGVERERHAIASLPQGHNAVGTFIPVARVADMLLHPGEPFDYDGRRLRYPDIRLVYWAGGNPFHHHQDLNRLVRAWQRPETVICHEPWWNPLARHCDIVLPAATMLERNDFAAGKTDLTLSAMHRAAEPPGESRTDYDAFSEIARKLGLEKEFTEGRTADEWVEELYERTRTRLAETGVDLPAFADFWAAGRGPDTSRGRGREDGHVVTPPVPDGPNQFQLLREDPQAHPLATPSGRIEVFSRTVADFGYDDCPGHPVWLEPREWRGDTRQRHPFDLISPQPANRLHSQYDHGAHSRSGKIHEREPVTVNRQDAAARGISDGDVVRLFNDRGACLAGAALSDDIRPGVLALPTGAWYDPADAGAAGSLDKHGNPNVLTRDLGTSRLAQGPTSGTTLVAIERYDGEPLPVTAFDPAPVGP
ncbi:molybdopterin-dependent oxidoreductase [Streptomyces sp. NPDC053560]|uniref:molybdopterin-dependent oxidoreductase n=1 Tax=Streptomyces sp. NPDC053560 TaxID=3365711 RepID=UPI0037D4831C